MAEPTPDQNASPARPDSDPRVTLDKVAARAGVHRTTVSQVLNNRKNCWASEETRRRIREAVEELGYRPNQTARALRSGKSHVIGFISPGFGLTSPRSRAYGLTEAAAKADYTVALSANTNDPESEDRLIRRLLDRSVDGLAIYPVDSGPHRELRRLVDSGFPVVTFDGAALLDFKCDDVSPDYAEVGRLQARHLMQLGRRRFCLANTIPEAKVNRVREMSIRRELARAGLPEPLEMRIPWISEFDRDDSQDGWMRDFFKAHRGQFDALIGYDSLVSCIIRVLQGMGIRIPGDVAVSGSGNSYLAIFGVMQLTSVSTSDDMAGDQAFSLLIDRIRTKLPSPGFRRLISPSRLIARTSSLG